MRYFSTMGRQIPEGAIIENYAESDQRYTAFDFPQGLMNKCKIIESDKEQITEN